MRKKFLNVGCGGPNEPIPENFGGWQQDRLDIDPKTKPDIVHDAREELPDGLAEKYDGIYCSHFLEHVYAHEVLHVMQGFYRALKPGGVVLARVPDIRAVFASVFKHDIGLDRPLYISPAGPITPLDVVYGWGREISSGNVFYAHKTAFTPEMLIRMFKTAKFSEAWSESARGFTYEIHAKAVK